MSLTNEEIAYLEQINNRIEFLKFSLNKLKEIIEYKEKLLNGEIRDLYKFYWYRELSQDEREQFTQSGIIPDRIRQIILKQIAEIIIKIETHKIMIENGNNDYEQEFKAKVAGYYRALMEKYGDILHSDLEYFRAQQRERRRAEMINFKPVKSLLTDEAFSKMWERSEREYAEAMKKITPEVLAEHEALMKKRLQESDTPEAAKRWSSLMERTTLASASGETVYSKITCPMCRYTRTNGVELKCGHKICEVCKHRLISRNGNCPICGKPINDSSSTTRSLAYSGMAPPALYMAQATSVSNCPSCRTRAANTELKCGHKVCDICKDTLISENGNCPRCGIPVDDSDDELHKKYLKYKSKYLQLKNTLSNKN